MDGLLPKKDECDDMPTAKNAEESSNAFGRAAFPRCASHSLLECNSCAPPSLPPSLHLPVLGSRVVSQEAGHSLRGGFLQGHCRPCFRQLLAGVGAVRSEEAGEGEAPTGGERGKANNRNSFCIWALAANCPTITGKDPISLSSFRFLHFSLSFSLVQ